MVSIITVNYNGFQDTCEFIESIRRYETYPYEIIVVDNASRENEGQKLKERYRDIQVICSEKNLGFAGGNNLGYRYAQGEYILYINNDIEIKTPFLQALIARFQSKKNIGLVSPKIHYAYAPGIIQYAGFTPMSPVLLRNHQIGNQEEDTGRYDQARETAFAHGACMFTSREVVEKAGSMTGIYFLFYEELDWSNQLRRAGYSIWYEPAVCVYHKESRSAEKGSPLREYYMTRSRILFARRNIHGVKKGLSCLYLATVVALKNIAPAVFHKDRQMAKAYFQGTWHGLTAKITD